LVNAGPIGRRIALIPPDARRSLAGPPKGNRNALKHGRYMAHAIERRREIAALLRAMRALAGSH